MLFVNDSVKYILLLYLKYSIHIIKVHSIGKFHNFLYLYVLFNYSLGMYMQRKRFYVIYLTLLAALAETGFVRIRMERLCFWMPYSPITGLLLL